LYSNGLRLKAFWSMEVFYTIPECFQVRPEPLDCKRLK
jgi:hypothetical protein